MTIGHPQLIINTAKYGIIFIIIIWLLYLTKNACDNELLHQIIGNNSNTIQLSINDLKIRMHKNLENTLVTLKSSEKELDNESLINSLPYWDFTQLSNLPNFKFVTFNNVCIKDDVFLLLIVASAPSAIERRNVIRHTWGSKNFTNMRVLFSLGFVDITTQAKIEEENQIHKDILQGNFIDTYDNLTYKQIMNLKYVTYYCPKVKHIMKLDDDIVVHIPNLMKFLQNGQPNTRGDAIFCVYEDNVPVLREAIPKWSVSYGKYPNSIYPRYCYGNYPTLYGYDVIYKLYRECQKGDFLYLEDVYITGIIAQRLDIQHDQAINFALTVAETDSIIDEHKEIKKDFLYSFKSLTVEEMLKLWKSFNINN